MTDHVGTQLESASLFFPLSFLSTHRHALVKVKMLLTSPKPETVLVVAEGALIGISLM